MNRIAPTNICAKLIIFAMLVSIVAPFPKLKAVSADAASGLPTAAEVIADLKERHPDKGHPRVMATADDFARMRDNAIHNSSVHTWFQVLKGKVDASLNGQLPSYQLEGGSRLLGVSRSVLSNIQRLGVVYQIVDEAEKATYANRAWAILQAAGSFSDWHPDHFLDVAEMTNAFAIGYDWFYDAWTDEQKEFLRDAIVEHGLEPAAEVYRGEVTIANSSWNRAGWLSTTNNWNTVVNGGIALGALAIADESEELETLAGEILADGLESIQLIFPLFEPDGAGEEGVSYWDYNATYLAYYLSALTTALGDDYGLSDKPGVDTTAYFPIYLAGTGNTAGTGASSFNYGDSGSGIVSTPAFLWFSNRFEDPGIAWYQSNLLNKSAGQQADAMDLLWFDATAVQPVLTLDKLFGRVEVGSMRSAWNDPNALFVGFKGGDNAFNHNHLDEGAFVLDALGVRWAAELGADDYNLPQYFNPGRDIYYRIRPEGQNTLVLNPSTGPGQNPAAKAAIVDSGFAAEQAFMVTDLTQAYASQADSVKRGVTLFDHRSKVLMQDEVNFKAPDGELYWFMHTGASVTIAEDGKSAMLQHNDRRLWATILTPGDNIGFQVRDAAPLPTSPNPSGQGVNTLSKLTIHAEGVDELRLSVLFVPLMPWEDIPASSDWPAIVPLDQWAVSGTNPPALQGITINGEPLSGFRADTYTYYGGKFETMPTVAATAEAGVDVSVAHPDNLSGTATITVQDGDRTAEYRVHLESSVHVPDEPVFASTHDGNVPDNTLDGDYATRWSAESLGWSTLLDPPHGEPQWIQYKLTQQQTLDHVDIAFFNGHLRQTKLDILLSVDGINWTTVFEGQSGGTSSELQSFTFDPTEARYVRIVGYGNTSNAFTSISEVGFEGKPAIAKPIFMKSASATLPVAEFEVGETANLQVAVQMTDDSYLDLNTASVRYISDKPSIASVNAEGVIEAHAAGTARISAEVMYNRVVKVGSVTIEVPDPNPVEEPPVEGTKQIVAAQGSPEIDGVIDPVWGKATPITTFYQTGASLPWIGVETDIEPSIRALWDENYLYILAEVKDSTVGGTVDVASDTEIVNNDSIELYIDINNEKSASYQEDDYRFVIDYQGQVEGYGQPEDILSSATLTDDGYRIEAAIPWEDYTPERNAEIGFEIAVTDNKAGGNSRTTWISWNDPESDAWQNPSVFGNLLLGGETNNNPNPNPGSNNETPPPSKPEIKVVSESDLKPGQQGAPTIQLNSGQTAVSLPINAAELLEGNPVNVRSSQGIEVAIPAEVLQALSQLSGTASPNGKILLRIEESATTNGVSTSIGKLKLGGKVIQLELTLEQADGTKRTLDDFQVPVQVTIPFDASKVDEDLLGVYHLNETTAQWEYVGGDIDKKKRTVAAALNHFSQYAVMEYTRSFADVPEDHWAYRTLQILAAKHIVQGVSATEYQPSGRTTRAEFTTMLVRLLGLDGSADAVPLKDIDANSWYANEIGLAYHAGLIKGVTATEFRLNDNMTREQMAVLLVRAYEYVQGTAIDGYQETADFQDTALISDWAAEAVKKAAAVGLMKGAGGGVFNPDSQAKRAETAQAILNFIVNR